MSIIGNKFVNKSTVSFKHNNRMNSLVSSTIEEHYKERKGGPISEEGMLTRSMESCGKGCNKIVQLLTRFVFFIFFLGSFVGLKSGNKTLWWVVICALHYKYTETKTEQIRLTLSNKRVK